MDTNANTIELPQRTFENTDLLASQSPRFSSYIPKAPLMILRAQTIQQSRCIGQITVPGEIICADQLCLG